jgi:metallo-beta-lactamase class B
VEGFIASLDRLSGLAKQPNQPLTVHLTTHGFSNGMTEVGYRLPTRKPGEPNPLVDPGGFLEQLASLRSGAEVRLEIERKAGR